MPDKKKYFSDNKGTRAAPSSGFLTIKRATDSALSPANRFLVEPGPFSTQIYISYQDKYEDTLKRVYSFTVPNGSFLEHFATDNGTFSRSIDAYRESTSTPEDFKLSPENVKGSEISNFFANLAVLSINGVYGASLTVEIINPFLIAQAIKEKKPKELQSGSSVAFLMSQDIMVALWDEFQNAKEAILATQEEHP